MTTREDATIINSLVRQALVSAQEVMGDNGLNAVLRTSGLERFIDGHGALDPVTFVSLISFPVPRGSRLATVARPAIQWSRDHISCSRALVRD